MVSWDYSALKRIKALRMRRSTLEGQLKRCEIQQSREVYMLRIENINILLADMGYVRFGNKRGAKF